MLLKAVLLAYSQGMISSRAIERACRDNVLFIALTGDAKPHFTTIADFVSRSRDPIASVFGQVLTLLDKESLIGRPMAAGAPAPAGTSHIPVGRLLSTASNSPRTRPSTVRVRARSFSRRRRRWSVRRRRCLSVTVPTMLAAPSTSRIRRRRHASSA
ncbi:MAG: transposase [Dokdonella sp.]